MANMASVLFCATAIVAVTTVAALGQGRRGPTADPGIQSFMLQRGQSIRVTPEGQISIFAQTQGDAADLQRRSQPITRGLGVWIAPDGKPRYFVDQ
jgi:hypothetical protein